MTRWRRRRLMLVMMTVTVVVRIVLIVVIVVIVIVVIVEDHFVQMRRTTRRIRWVLIILVGLGQCVRVLVLRLDLGLLLFLLLQINHLLVRVRAHIQHIAIGAIGIAYMLLTRRTSPLIVDNELIVIHARRNIHNQRKIVMTAMHSIFLRPIVARIGHIHIDAAMIPTKRNWTFFRRHRRRRRCRCRLGIAWCAVKRCCSVIVLCPVLLLLLLGLMRGVLRVGGVGLMLWRILLGTARLLCIRHRRHCLLLLSL
mmetsp:Transcript_36589/g.60209  ORF Transcript_36589/g.60209 Transcript_36589/m.60209 type:complete len:254 (-) Transcript_36589:372-1133(-)